MALSPNKVILYAADAADLAFCVGAAGAAGIPLGNVIGNFASAWEFVSGGNYLVIAVGGQANAALYYNPCGWANPAGEAGGQTPFAIAAAPRDTLPGANYYVNAAGSDAADSLYLVNAYAAYAVTDSYPSVWDNPPSATSPSDTCVGNPNVTCPCAGSYYGGDSCQFQSVTCGSYLFYGKPTGYGTSAIPACTCSECLSSGATSYSVWGLQGPGDAGSDTPSQWGAAQAQAAINEWKTDSDVHNQSTIFFDVESGEGGWGTDAAANQEVLEAALSAIVGAGLGLNPGVYISLGSSDNKWNTFFGASYVPSTPFVLWAALHECYSCTDAASLWPHYYQYTPIVAGGQRVAIAQYAVGGCSGVSGDLDFMTQNPRIGRFQPVPF